MKEKIKCPRCGSDQVKKVEGTDDFLPFKGEGEPVRKAKEKTKQKYICLEEDCGYEWEGDLDSNL
jgi:transposase-like protein